MKNVQRKAINEWQNTHTASIRSIQNNGENIVSNDYFVTEKKTKGTRVR